jgi:hypothetical protein
MLSLNMAAGQHSPFATLWDLRITIHLTYNRLAGKVTEAPKSGSAIKSQITRRKSPLVYQSQ